MTNPAPVKGVTWREVANEFDIDLKTVRRWIKQERLKKLKNKHIDPSYRGNYLPIWRLTCTFKKAATKLGVNINTISKWRNRKILETVNILGHDRITLDSIEKAEPPAKIRQKLREKEKAEKELKRFLRSQQARSRTLKRPDVIRRARPSPAPQMLNYKPAHVAVSGFASKNLTTLEEASMATGESIQFLMELFLKGGIRGETKEDQVYLYISAVEARQDRINRGIKLTR